MRTLFSSGALWWAVTSCASDLPATAHRPASARSKARHEAPCALPDTTGFKVMTYNIERSGADPRWMDVFREEDPDLAVLVEVGTWDDAGNAKLRDVLAELNAALPSERAYRGDVTQDTDVPHTGLALLSRFEIVERRQLGSLRLRDGTHFRPPHDLALWGVDVEGRLLHVLGVHLKCCAGPPNERSREATVEGLMGVLDSMPEAQLIVAGDFNAHSPADAEWPGLSSDLGTGALARWVAPDATRGSASHRFYDTFRELNPSVPGASYGHRDPSHASRIDYILINEPLLDALVGPASVGDTASARSGSDHFAVDVVLEWPR